MVVIVVPFPSVLSIMIFPPCASTMRLQIGNPKPMPLALVVKSGFHIFSMVSFFIPVPVSVKVNAVFSFVCWLLMVKVPPFGIASKAFLMMFTKTRFSFDESTDKCGIVFG